jgi:hypothetical protein
MNFDDPFTIITAVFVAIAVGVLAYFFYNLGKPTVTRRATVTDKRGEGGTGRGVGKYRCTFEFEDGTREEFNVSIAAYSSLNPGDVGFLKTKGLIFWGFQKESGEGLGPGNLPLIPEAQAQIQAALFRGQKIEAIRLFRECTGAGLAEAKLAVEQLEAKLRAAEPDRFAGAGGS